jgi:hypothetical protein
MTIHYNNGQVFEAVLLYRTDDSIRVAIQGSDDIRELNRINGTWVSDECEAVHVEFAWERHNSTADLTEADCVCSHELAARLIHALFAGENEPEQKPAPVTLSASPVYHQVV